MVSHEVWLGEKKRMRFEFSMFNLFNQKTGQYVFDRFNREDRSSSAGIDLSKGFDYNALLAAADRRGHSAGSAL